MKFSIYALFIFTCISAKAQVFTVGNGTAQNTATTYPTPFGDNKEGTRAQYLYRASELTAAGMTAGTIRQIIWDVVAGSNTGAHEQLTISVGTTSVNTLSATSWETGLTIASGPADYTPLLGSNYFLLSPGLVWDGVSNIIVEVCHGEFGAVINTTNTENAIVASTTGLSFNGSHTYAADDVPGGCGEPTTTNTGLQTTRPNIKFELVPKCYAPVGPVTSTVTAYTATLNWGNSATIPSNFNAYQYEVNVDPNPPTGGTNTTTNSASVSNLLPNTKYYVHLRTVCNNSNEFYSDWILDSFTTLEACDIPNVTIDRIYGSTAVATWDPVPTAYVYEYAVTLEPNPPLGGGIRTQYTSVQLSGLMTNGVVYHFFIRAFCTPTPSSSWTYKYFSSGKELSVDNSITQDQAIVVSPNPASSYIVIDKLRSKNLSISISDISGKVLLSRSVLAEKTEIDIKNWNSGLYFIRYSTDTETKTIKFIKE